MDPRVAEILETAADLLACGDPCDDDGFRGAIGVACAAIFKQAQPRGLFEAACRAEVDVDPQREAQDAESRAAVLREAARRLREQESADLAARLESP